MAIQRNLRLDTEYSIITSWYAELEAGIVCDNCGRNISNVCEIRETNGAKHIVGMDCAATLSGIKDSLLLSQTEASFQLARSARATIQRFCKNYPEGIVTVKTFDTERNYYKQIGAGSWALKNDTPYVRNWKQYPAEVWTAYVFPMIKQFSQNA